MELTSEGDSIWKQTTTSYDTLTTDNFFENCKLLPDGGLIGAGWAAISGLGQQMWLLKTDSMGCDGTEWTCDVSYLEEVSQRENNIILFPNPVRENLHIRLNNSELNNNVQITNNNVQKTKNNLTIEQFSNLTIDKKLKYSSKNPNNTFWGEKEEQEMRELSRKLAYAFPFSVLRGEVDIFAIDPSLSAQVERVKLKVSTAKNAGEFPLKKGARGIYSSIEITIYDINGRVVKKETLDVRQKTLEINVSNLQKGVYFVRVGENVAKFVKE